MRYIAIALVVLILTMKMGLAVGVAVAPLASPRQTSVQLVRILSSRGLVAGQDTLALLLHRQKRFATVLVSGVRSPRPASRLIAIYLLGVYRINAGVPALITSISFRSVGPKNSRILLGPSSFYPAAEALWRIGMPSVRAILKALPQETNALRRKLMVRVLIGVEGRAVTRFRLKRAIAKAPNAAAKANLKAALGDVTTSVPPR